jgi:lysophospholipase L1-like esterase
LLISLDVFVKMKAYCLEHAIQLLIAMIPTKESVYARYLENDPALENTAIKSLLTNERAVTAIVKAFFENHGIPYVNLLPQLQEQVTRFQLYPGNFDGHPNKNGYRVIAENVERYLRNLPLQAAGSGVLVSTDHVGGAPPH